MVGHQKREGNRERVPTGTFPGRSVSDIDLESVLIGGDDVVPRARYTSAEFLRLGIRAPVGAGVAGGVP